MELRRAAFSSLVAASFAALPLPALAQNVPYLHAPAVTEYALHNPGGTTILPDGRLLDTRPNRRFGHDRDIEFLLIDVEQVRYGRIRTSRSSRARVQ